MHTQIYKHLSTCEGSARRGRGGTIWFISDVSDFIYLTVNISASDTFSGLSVIGGAERKLAKELYCLSCFDGLKIITHSVE